MSRLSELQPLFRKLLPLLVISLSGVTILPVSTPTNAQTPLTKAVIQDLRNLVQLMPQRQPKRKAQRADAMVPGDGLSTGRLSLADLRFNDGSLTRVGEQAVFQFLPKTRNFTLNNGTVLLLIPPGRGRTNIKTPSAAAAIRGSALFVRYDKATDTTVIGALTNSGIEVFNRDGSKSKVLQAGQMMVVVKGQLQQLYDFDLRSFYDTSDLVRGLDLTRSNPNPTGDPALDSVRAETSEALSKQSPIRGEGTIKNPSFIQLSNTSSDSGDTGVVQQNGQSPVDSLLRNTELQSETNTRNSNRNNNPTTQTPNQPTQPDKPVDTPKPQDPGKPADTPKPQDPGKPVDTPKPPDSDKPVDTPKPQDPGKPVDTPKPQDPGKPVDTPKPQDPGKPVDTPKPPDSDKPVDPPKPQDPGKPVDPPKPPDTKPPTDTPKPPDTKPPTDTPKPPDTKPPTDTPKPPDTGKPSDKPIDPSTLPST